MAWLYKRKGSKKLWIGWRSGSSQFLKSTGTANKAAAEKKLREQEFLLQAHIDGRLTEQFYEALTGKARPSVPLSTAVQDWLKEAGATTSPGTVEKYEHVANDFLKFIRAGESAPLLGDVKTEDVRQFLNDQRTRISARTVNVYRKILSGFFVRAVKNEIIKEQSSDADKGIQGQPGRSR